MSSDCCVSLYDLNFTWFQVGGITFLSGRVHLCELRSSNVFLSLCYHLNGVVHLPLNFGRSRSLSAFNVFLSTCMPWNKLEAWLWYYKYCK